MYDNLGAEALYKPDGGFRSGFDFLIVSDASAPLDFDPRSLKRLIKPGHRILRLIDVATDQVRSLRARSLVAEFSRSRNVGVYLRSGNTTEDIYVAAGHAIPPGDYLRSAAVQRAANFHTTLRRLKVSELGLLCRHGYEVADATLSSRQPDRFSHVPYRLISG